MAILVDGHDTNNDDLFNGSNVPDSTNEEEWRSKNRAANPFQWGGQSEQWHLEEDPNNPGQTRWVKGQVSGAEYDRDRYRTMGSIANNRGAYQINYGQANRDRELGMGSRWLSTQARGEQDAAMQLMRNRAMGNDLVSSRQAAIDMERAQAAQMSGAASARGAGAMALAQMNANANIAGAQTAISRDAQLAAMQEQIANQQAWYGAATGIRQGDFAMRGQDQAQQQQSAAQAQAQAQVEMQQRALNQQAQMGYEQMAFDVNRSQLQAGMQQKALEEGHWATQAGLDQHAVDRDTKTGGAIAGAVGSIFTPPGTLGSDPLFKQGVVPIGRTAPMGAIEPWMPPLHSDPSAKAAVREEARLEGLAQGIRAGQAAMYAHASPMQAYRDTEPGLAPAPGRTEMERTSNALDPISYEYTYDPGKRRYGITTSQLKQTPAGASVVRDTPMGEVVDVPQATGLQFAQIADLQDQVNELRGERGAARGELRRGTRAGDAMALHNERIYQRSVPRGEPMGVEPPADPVIARAAADGDRTARLRAYQLGALTAADVKALEERDAAADPLIRDNPYGEEPLSPRDRVMMRAARMGQNAPRGRMGH